MTLSTRYQLGLAMILCVWTLAVSEASARDQARDRTRRRTPVVEVFEAARDAVVNISTTQIIEVSPYGGVFDLDDLFHPGPRRRYKTQTLGSGFVIHPDGYVITNAHVISQTQDPKITFADGTEVAATLIAADEEHDLAVLKLDVDHPLPTLALGRSDDLMIGETVIAIGNPLGYQNTVTSGIVSALDRELVFSKSGQDLVYTGLIQTDAAINPGSSGGPLLNALGQLIGINSAIRGDAQNMGFAIPVNHLRALLPTILSPEQLNRVQVGLRVRGRAQPHVVEVVTDSPADLAGLQPGDKLLTIDGQPVTDALDFYFQMVTRKAGQTVVLTVQRDDRRINAALKLTPVPTPDGIALARQKLGIVLNEVRDGRTSILLIDSVERNSPAAQIDVRPGDILWQLGRFHVSTLQQVGQRLTNVQPGDAFAIRVIRTHGRRRHTLAGQIEAR